MVCIPIAVVKLLQSMCRKISGLLPFPQRRCGTAVWPVSSVCYVEHAQPTAEVADANAISVDWWTQFSLPMSSQSLAFSMQEVQMHGITSLWTLSKYDSRF